MKKSELKLLIREIVREEVKLVLRSEIKKMKLKQENKSVPVVRNKSKSLLKNKMKYVKDATLNSLLNETAQSGEWRTLGKYTSEDVETIAARTDNQSNQNDNTNIETKDYRALMKRVDEKAANIRR
jgi:hypothetical protein|tara:strand:- start:2821 stop:3198 length:378 start_codon:yes stop_codon:yes gene_type:complete